MSDFYVSLDYVNAYINPDPKVGAEWATYSDEMKQNYIDYSERIVDNSEWVGESLEVSQLHAFPRSFDDLKEFDAYNDLESRQVAILEHDNERIPEPIRKALCEIIIDTIYTKKFQTLQAMQEVNVSEFTAGSTSFTFGGAGKKYPLPRQAWMLAYLYHRYWWRNSSSTRIHRI